MTKCGIIRDLFTAYVSGVGSEDTRALVEEHIKTCEGCKNKLAEVQSRVAAQLRENDAASINVFKTMKKRIFRRNVLVAVTASALAVVIIFSGFWYALRYNTPIAYAEGIVRIEKNIIQRYLDDGTTATVSEIDIILARDYYAAFQENRLINISGIETEVLFIYFTETLFTKWFPQDDNSSLSLDAPYHRVGGFDKASFRRDAVDYPSLPLEIYYITMPRKQFDRVCFMSDEDFYAQRTNGVLVWSGTLE